MMTMQVAGQRFGGMTDNDYIQDNVDNVDNDDNDDNVGRIEVWSNDRRIVDDPGFMRRVCSILGLRL